MKNSLVEEHAVPMQIALMVGCVDGVGGIMTPLLINMTIVVACCLIEQYHHHGFGCNKYATGHSTMAMYYIDVI